MDDKTEISLHDLRELQAIAQTGLNYAKDDYDKERYLQILELISPILSKPSNVKSNEVLDWCFNEIGYATPKLCVRALILKEDSVLMVKERGIGLWALPGGWADVNLSAKESVEKEVYEETGLQCKAIRMLALLDKLKHDHPPHWPHTYLAFFQCETLGGELQRSSLEIEDVDYFPLKKLPELCTHRVTAEQIHDMVQQARSEDKTPCLFD